MLDVHFKITPVPEPEMGCTHLVEQFEILPADGAWPCETLAAEPFESFTTDDPYGAVEAFREAQTYTLEQRFDLYAARGW
jgi:hypothetical protein